MSTRGRCYRRRGLNFLDCDIAIVGAGAAGLATAIFARRANPARSVVLLESARRPGAKILVSGGSRCNVTNAIVGDRDFWGGRSAIVRRVLKAFPVEDTVHFFRDIGVPLHEEPNGKLFPDTNRSRDVLDALLREVDRVGATLFTGRPVTEVARDGARDAPGFVLTTPGGTVHARQVVLAAGGQALPKSGSDGSGFVLARRLGHTIVPPTPGLVALVLDPAEPLHRPLAGVSQEVELTIWVDGSASLRLTGSLLWTHIGASGPVAMNASRHWHRATLENRTVSISANFCPGENFDAVDRRWTRFAAERGTSSLVTLLSASMSTSMANRLLQSLGLDPRQPLTHLTREHRRRLVHALTAWPLQVIATRGYTYAEVTAGGVALGEIDPATMESRVCRGLFLVGEVLDVDGRIGGFNFQWAWSSACVAGRALGLGRA